MIDFPLRSENYDIRPVDAADIGNIFNYLKAARTGRTYQQNMAAIDGYVAQCRIEKAQGDARKTLTLGAFGNRDIKLKGMFHAKATGEDDGEWRIGFPGFIGKDDGEKYADHAVETLWAVMPYLEKRLKVKAIPVSVMRHRWLYRSILERCAFQPVGIDDIGYAHYVRTLKPVQLAVVPKMTAAF